VATEGDWQSKVFGYVVGWELSWAVLKRKEVLWIA
jgi:hypothetical protein